MNQLFFLGEATIRLYPATPTGAPDMTQPVWIGACSGTLRISERWINVETRPSGSTYPRKHPLVQQYQVSIDRVWVFPISPTASLHLRDFVTDRNRYVLDIYWEDDETGNWVRRTFFGVTISERNLDSDEVFSSTDAQVFDAEYFVSDQSVLNVLSNPGAIPPPTLPLVVKYRGSSAAIVPLYSYDAGTGLFTEYTVGVSAGRATIAHNPNRGGNLEITFPTYAPMPFLTAAGEFHIGQLIESIPLLTDFPRLEFWVGPKRAASVGVNGQLYAPTFIETGAEVPATPDTFLLYAGNKIWATIAMGAVTANLFIEDVAVVEALGDGGIGLGDGGNVLTG